METVIILTAISAFVSTNLDDMFILAVFLQIQNLRQNTWF